MSAATLWRTVLLDALDKGGVQLSAQAQPSECRVERRARRAAQHVRDPHQPSPSIAFLDLTIDQLRRYLPPPRPSSDPCHPLPEMGRQGLEIEVQSVAREHGEAAARQPPMQLVNHRMGGGLGSRAQVQHHHDFGQRIESQPEPQHMRPGAKPGPQFVQLEVREVQPLS